ncbi:dTMP kinase [Hazenella sp. IB182357]|uniref:Thymidylate kinase n=1 Tax=Polycladospora coralii TaxID=2771432 RepID=A0A926N9T6_9BACL|nr:dTMP kinase [Polycladospora coralii]MBD1372487.1 dTMP kinase [Polycladospora coralii]MBS7531809.1 dTMP kinase [Polycladospora coralii]
MSGLFITFEGPEGAGKTTQMKLLHDFLLQNQIPCTVVREPGGTIIGDKIRSILLNPLYTEMTSTTEILLYAASRAQLVEEKIVPALEQGHVVLCDRYIDSSIAYQCYGGRGEKNEVVQVNQLATHHLLPKRTYLLDLTIKQGQMRLEKRGMSKDRMELKDASFHERVRKGYLELSKANEERFLIIHGEKTIEEVYSEILCDFKQLFRV